ncbi:MAG: DUF6327 family protein [Maribacter sp.]
MREYSNIKEIKKDLKRLHLERQIAWEELKGLRHEVKEDLSPYNWVNTLLSAAKKYGFLYLIRKILR